MSDPTWVPVVPADEVTAPPWPCHDVAGVPVRLVRGPDDQILAIGPTCPHLDSPLDRAEVEEGRVLCPRHVYTYDADTGANVHPGFERDAALPVYPVEVRDGMVHVGVPGPA